MTSNASDATTPDDDPEAPWRDEISGEVDYEAMKDDLGIDDGTEDIDEDGDWP
jgi:hypothetical protein